MTSLSETPSLFECTLCEMYVLTNRDDKLPHCDLCGIPMKRCDDGILRARCDAEDPPQNSYSQRPVKTLRASVRECIASRFTSRLRDKLLA